MIMLQLLLLLMLTLFLDQALSRGPSDSIRLGVLARPVSLSASLAVLSPLATCGKSLCHVVQAALGSGCQHPPGKARRGSEPINSESPAPGPSRGRRTVLTLEVQVQVPFPTSVKFCRPGRIIGSAAVLLR